MRNMQRLGVAAGILLLAGCATTDDPREGGFFSGLYGLGSGAYDQRIAEREQNLQALKQIEAGSVAEQSSLQRDKAASTAELQQLEAQSRQMEAELRSLSGQIEKTKASTAQAEKRKQSLKQKATDLDKALKTHQKQISTAGDDTQVAKYRAEEARLQREIKALKQEMSLLD